MKKLTLFLLCFINTLTIYSFLPKNNVYASTNEYFKVLKSDTYIYQDETFQTKLFIVPYGYFVLGLQEYNGYYKVSYGDKDENYPVIIGYMKSECLTRYSKTPQKPYVVFTINSIYSDILFNDCEKQNPYFNVPKNSTLTFFGEYKNENNEILLYVYYNSKLGYVDKNSIKSFTVPNSTDVIETPPVEPDNSTEVNSNNEFMKNETLQIVIIVGISVITISVVYFLFKPTKNKVEPAKNTPYEFYDEIE